MKGSLALFYAFCTISYVFLICAASESFAATPRKFGQYIHASRHHRHVARVLVLPSPSDETEPTGSNTDTPLLTSSLSPSSESASPSTSVSGEPSSSNLPSATPLPTNNGSRSGSPELDLIHERRMSFIVGTQAGANEVSTWLSTLGSDGKWPDSEVDYTTGCAARRANWPAQAHWTRILTMAATWHGGIPNGAQEYVKNESLRQSISRAADYWFSRDFSNSNPDCLDFGGTTRCPCDNPANSLWNTNWFSNIILIPKLVGQTCLILSDTLTASQLNYCIVMTGRSYELFFRPINGVSGGLTGANALDVARIGMDKALLTGNTTLLAQAYERVQSEIVIQDKVRADGIRADGSFGQHDGILYNGNYGKELSNNVLHMEIEAAGTQFGASPVAQAAFGTLFDGNRWMIVRNALTGILHWDFSVLGRFLVFPVADNQPTRDISQNLTEIAELGRLWNNEVLKNFASSLSGSGSNANVGRLMGNKMFYANDYMVHRGQNYVSTIKLWSSRTRHTECTNSANPFGFHLADGVHYTFLRGDEYEDIPGAWDWNLIPGITTDYGATPLTCANTRLLAIEAFVGGVSDGQIGVAAMRYTNPVTRSLRWQKVWFFLEDDVQHVMIANIASSTDAPVYSVLDQRRHAGPILVDGTESLSGNFSGVRSLWHGDVGYTFPDVGDATSLSIQVGNKPGNWQAIGTSLAPPFTADLYAAWIHHKTLDIPISYTVFPGTSGITFKQKSKKLRLQTVSNNENISAIFDDDHETAMVVFWASAGGSVTIKPSDKTSSITIAANGNIAVIYKLRTGDVTVSDPSQGLQIAEVSLSLGPGRKPPVWGTGTTKVLAFRLPQGGVAGSSVTQNVR